jgi:hypothetical protein
MNSKRRNGDYVARTPVGRPRSLPPDALERVLQHHRAGLSYQLDVPPIEVVYM